MIKKVFLIFLAVFFLMNSVAAFDSSDWVTAEIGEETFKIPPEYANNPYKNDSDVYWFDDDSIFTFSIRFVNPRLMDLYGYEMSHSSSYKKVKIGNHDAVHFKCFDYPDMNYSVLWFSSREEFYLINWKGHEITPMIEEVVKSSSKSNYTRDEFYDILNEEYVNYKIIKAIESQSDDDYTFKPSGMSSYGSNGWSYGKFYY